MSARDATPRTMRAAVLHGPRDLRVEEVPEPPPLAPDELLIEVAAVGVCGTDAAEWSSGGHMVPMDEPHRVTCHQGPTVLGHEFSGVVLDTGAEVPSEWRGRLVACAGAVSCGSCPACLAGRTNQCRDYWVVGLHRHGAMAERVSAPIRSCSIVESPRLTPEEAALAQPMGIAVHAARQPMVAGSKAAVVVGIGGIGACLVHVLSSWGIDVTAIDVDSHRLALARELGATRCVRSTGAVEDLAGADGAAPQLVFEVTGRSDVLQTALAGLAVGGRLILVGIQTAPLGTDLGSLTVREQSLVGTNSLNVPVDLPEALRLLELRAGGWDVLAPRVLPLGQVVTGALTSIAQGGTAQAVKVLIDPRAVLSRGLYEHAGAKS